MNIEKVTRLSNVQKEIDNFCQKHFLKNNNEKNNQDQNIRSKSKKEPLHGKAFKAKRWLKVQFCTKSGSYLA